MNDLKAVEIYTDGACSGNPGPGGWAALLRYKGHELELYGGELYTTNNRMELTAVIEGLKTLKKHCSVKVFTDSQYVVNGLNKGWAKSWRDNGWKKSDNKPALNSDLWRELLEAVSKHNYQIIWLNGHSGHPENERCDIYAVKLSKIFSTLSITG
jgi:ribonuclease HI